MIDFLYYTAIFLGFCLLGFGGAYCTLVFLDWFCERLKQLWGG